MRFCRLWALASDAVSRIGSAVAASAKRKAHLGSASRTPRKISGAEDQNRGNRDPLFSTRTFHRGRAELRLNARRSFGRAHVSRLNAMCRNIKTLFNFEPPVTDSEIRAASLQFVRKISGYNKPSKTNETVFFSAVDEVAMISKQLLASLESTTAPKTRQEQVARATARAARKFGR
jgi:hypothetical protein